MAFKYTYHVMSRITKHGIYVYPLESFGLLLGISQSADEAHIIAALPVGKTKHWYEPEGRFANIEAAAVMAATIFNPWGLCPLGLYVTPSDNRRGHREEVCSFTPKLDHLPWLVVQPIDGGEAISASTVYHARGGEWHTVEAQKVCASSNASDRNPKRISTAWNSAWGILDYGNCHETELQRLAQS